MLIYRRKTDEKRRSRTGLIFVPAQYLIKDMPGRRVVITEKIIEKYADISYASSEICRNILPSFIASRNRHDKNLLASENVICYKQPSCPN
jgi:hypothetical protein